MEFGSEYIYASIEEDEEAVSDGEEEDWMYPSPDSGLSVGSEAILIEQGGASGALGAPPTGTSTSADSVRLQPGHPPAPPPPTASAARLSSSSLFASPVPAALAGRASRASCSVDGRESQFPALPVPPRRHLGKSVTERIGAYSQHQRQRHSTRTADVNVVCICFSQLVSPANMHTGDPVRCSNCSAILSSISQVTTVSDGSHQWCCDFCDYLNVVELHPAEQPRNYDVTYMVAPPPCVPTDPSRSSDSLVIFCIDISGSMSVSTEVPGSLNLKGRRVLENYHRFMEAGDGNQLLPSQRYKTVTNVTRLQAVQAAIDQQLTDLARDHPQQRPAIITFNNDVTFIGDGICEPVRIAEHNLHNKEVLVKAGLSAPMPGPANATRSVLASKLFELEEGGRTALGPALVMAVAVASKVRGSRIVLCTDGLANVGLGDMEGQLQQGADADDKRSQQASEFYRELGSEAASKGVSISVVTILGTSCKLAQLSVVAQQTSGQVSTVDPLKLEKEFSSVLRQEVLATNATATFVVHKSLYIETEAGEPMVHRIHHGNVKRNSEITFKFGVKKDYRQALRTLSKQTTAASVAAPVPAPTPTPTCSAVVGAAAAEAPQRGTDAATASVHSAPLQESVQESSKQHAAAKVITDETPMAAAAVPAVADLLTYPTQAQFASPVAFTPADLQTCGRSSGTAPTQSGHADVAVTIPAATSDAPSSSVLVEQKQTMYSSTAATTTTTTTTSATTASTTTRPVPDEVCFQIQVEYTDLAGGRALRVHTVKRPITIDRGLSEKKIKPAVISVHAEQQAGRHMMCGRSDASKDYLERNLKLLSRSTGSRSAANALFSRVRPQMTDRGAERSEDSVFAGCYENATSHLALYEEDTHPFPRQPGQKAKGKKEGKEQKD